MAGRWVSNGNGSHVKDVCMSPRPEFTLSRRSLIAAGAGLATAGLGAVALPATVIAAQDSGQIKEVPREKCLIHGITGNQLTDYNTFNPFLPGIATSSGYPIVNEGLFYYNAYNTEAFCGPEGSECSAGEIPWLGTGY